MKYISLDCLKMQNVCLSDIIAVRQKTKRGYCVDHMNNGRNNNAIVFFCSEGARYTLSDGTHIEPKSGDILYIPVGSKYRLEVAENECDIYTIFFRLFDENGEQLFFSNHMLHISRCNSQLPDLMNKCIRMYTSYTKNNLLLCAYMYNVLHEFVLCYEKETAPSPIDAALSYINRNLNTVISVKELALSCAMSESSFRQVFKKSVGLSPLKYINTVRIKKAAELLKDTDFSITTISDMLGFYDDSYFIKMFKKAYNFSPSEYRKTETKKSMQR